MKQTATLTSKGQLVIPKDFRDKLGLTKGSRLTIQIGADGSSLIAKPTLSVDEAMGMIKLRKKTGETSEADYKNAVKSGYLAKNVRK